MCDNSTEQDIQRFTEQGGKLNRRQFNQLLALGTLSAVLPQFAVAEENIMQQEVRVKTPHGSADCLFTAPKTGRHPAVVMWPDIKGRRAAFDLMGQGRLRDVERLGGASKPARIMDGLDRTEMSELNMQFSSHS